MPYKYSDEIAAGLWGVKRIWDVWCRDRHRVSELYKYALDNYWFQSTGLADESSNPSLKGRHSADIVIIGGGYAEFSDFMPTNREIGYAGPQFFRSLPIKAYLWYL